MRITRLPRRCPRDCSPSLPAHQQGEPPRAAADRRSRLWRHGTRDGTKLANRRDRPFASPPLSLSFTLSPFQNPMQRAALGGWLGCFFFH
ncbi:hypothetical protein CTA1_6451 [Colletotrichum tanaceti]|uniref:Uncharacterized protein n=1 Tax=Colletotrichum tanaceti TaxID=1306861 RepID=A0A4U6XFQ3_9PEZI|nr:hypothetical protein CTA1_6451 [Colletotrichum tanaceti]